mmetsp:Transcript_17774/g.57238  ORF Transcript_17774/g.57238 Transcript_17774/m.57238 type:complete len:394 (+) Transcript_17774:75-1256(+)
MSMTIPHPHREVPSCECDSRERVSEQSGGSAARPHCLSQSLFVQVPLHPASDVVDHMGVRWRTYALDDGVLCSGARVAAGHGAAGRLHPRKDVAHAALHHHADDPRGRQLRDGLRARVREAHRRRRERLNHDVDHGLDAAELEELAGAARLGRQLHLAARERARVLLPAVPHAQQKVAVPQVVAPKALDAHVHDAVQRNLKHEVDDDLGRAVFAHESAVRDVGEPARVEIALAEAVEGVLAPDVVELRLNLDVDHVVGPLHRPDARRHLGAVAAQRLVPSLGVAGEGVDRLAADASAALEQRELAVFREHPREAPRCDLLLAGPADGLVHRRERLAEPVQVLARLEVFVASAQLPALLEPHSHVDRARSPMRRLLPSPRRGPPVRSSVVGMNL